ncbi:hypothetical protein RND71_024768 [Anisodus tanguticus]|uniref:Uncharacterized protein n=1 Tax=Anisodus tanguticus TaxID=243964 RepID=A0AAE1RR26_9SOLA|nr:hypothetical protein RND71_024768 [Anisodus tanguticus]
MDIDLRLPSQDHDKEEEEEEQNGIINMLDNEEKVHSDDGMHGILVNSEPDVMAIGAADSLPQMDKLNSRPVTLDGYFGPQQSVQGMIQLNLMAPARDNYYGNQQTIQGLGQLNSIAPTHDGYYGAQPTMHGLVCGLLVLELFEANQPKSCYNLISIVAGANGLFPHSKFPIWHSDAKFSLTKGGLTQTRLTPRQIYLSVMGSVSRTVVEFD